MKLGAEQERGASGAFWISLAAHAVAGLTLVASPPTTIPADHEEPMDVTLIDSPPPPPPPPEPELPVPLAPPPGAPASLAAAPKVPRQAEDPRPAPAEPTPPAATVTAPAPAEPPTAPARRVFGVELESTTTAGQGPLATDDRGPGAGAGAGAGPARAGGTGGGDGTSGFVPPRRLRAPTPAYPAALKAQAIEGDVGLEVMVDASGAVGRVAVIASSGHVELDRSATEAASRSTYQPATLGGVALARSIVFTVRFRLHP